MSAFQAYAGAYEVDGGAFSWRCYATARVYEVRQRGHAPHPKAPRGRKWVAPIQQAYEQAVECLVDETVGEFSQILLLVEPRSCAQPAERKAAVPAVAMA